MGKTTLCRKGELFKANNISKLNYKETTLSIIQKVNFVCKNSYQTTLVKVTTAGYLQKLIQQG